MRRYRYTARNKDGDLLKGVIYGQNESDCMQQLRMNHVYPVKVKSMIWREGGFITRIKPIQYLEIGIFCKQFSTLLKSGIAIPQALRLLSIQNRSSKLQGIIYDLLQSLEQGESLYQGFSKHDAKLPEFFSALIRAGEMTNKLGLVLERLSSYYQQEDQFKKQVQQLMMYPLILLVCTFGVIFFIIFKIIPGFQEIYASFEAKLPDITYCLLSISQHLCIHLKKYLIGFLLYLLISSYLLKLTSVKRWLKMSQYRFPVLGKLNKKLLTARLARTWSLLLGNGLEVLPAIELTSETLGSVLEIYLQEIAANLKRGVSLTNALRQTTFFPDLFLEMVGVGEESGSLASMMDRVAEIYETDGKNQMQHFLTILEPALLLTIALVVGIIILAIMLPMFNMIKLI